VLTRSPNTVDPHTAHPLPARAAVLPREWIPRWRRAATTAEAHARGVRLRGLILENAVTEETGLIVVTVESRVRLEPGARAVALDRGTDRTATMTLRGDTVLRRNGRRARLSRVRVGDAVRVTRRPGAALAAALDARNARRSG
jgi:hypothetical protein